jgi:hypothetical protein
MITTGPQATETLIFSLKFIPSDTFIIRTLRENANKLYCVITIRQQTSGAIGYK